IEDSPAASLLRLGDTAGTLRRGTLVDVVGTRSTKSGMLPVRVERPPVVIGSAAEPAAAVVPTGGAGERLEAQLLIVHGTVTSKAGRSTAGNVAFRVDHGRGPVRLHGLSATRI